MGRAGEWVAMLERTSQRRQPNGESTEALGPALPEAVAQVRVCLKCDEPFSSVANRLCKSCRETIRRHHYDPEPHQAGRR